MTSVVDDNVVIISSDSEVEAQLTVKKLKPRYSKPSNLKSPTRVDSGKRQAGKARLSDSDGAIDLTSDPDISPTNTNNRFRGRTSSEVMARQSLQSNIPSSASQTLMPPHAPGPSCSKATLSDTQTAALDKHLPKRTIADTATKTPLPAIRESSNHRLSSKLSKATPKSLHDATQPFKECLPTLADVISMSLGGFPSSSPKEIKPPRLQHGASLPMQQKAIPHPSSSVHSRSIQKLAQPPADAEIIDLCSDSDNSMDISERPTLEVGSSSSNNSATVFSVGSQSVLTQSKGKAPVRLPSVFSPPRVSSPSIIPTSSSLPSPSSSKHSAFTPPFMASHKGLDTANISVDRSNSTTNDYARYLDVPSSLHSNAMNDNLAVSNVHCGSSRSNSLNPSVHEVTSRKRSHKSSSPNSSPWNQVQDLAIPSVVMENEVRCLKLLSNGYIEHASSFRFL